MKVVEVDINLLKPSEYNPRKMSPIQAMDIKASLDKFGLVEPIVVNEWKERKNIIIGGHQRYYLLKEKGEKKVFVNYINLPTLEDEVELNLRLNKNTATWDLDKLANQEVEMLKKVGFTREEIEKLFDVELNVEGEQHFTRELLEENNYVVLVFDNIMDWNFVTDKLGIESKDSLDSKKDYKRRGIGRVIDGSTIIKYLKTEGGEKK